MLLAESLIAPSQVKPTIITINHQIFATNATQIGTLYLLLAICAGIEASLFSTSIRIELLTIISTNHINCNLHNAIITTHALLMIFFLVMPTLAGAFSNLFVPILIGSPDMAMPRLNTISCWLLVPAFILLCNSATMQIGAGVGWTIYPLHSTQNT